jgi:hypothetical protein
MVTLKHGKVDETFRRTTLGSCEKTIQKQIRRRVPLYLSQVSHFFPFFHSFFSPQNMVNSKPQNSFSRKVKKWIYLEEYTKWYIYKPTLKIYTMND